MNLSNTNRFIMGMRKALSDLIMYNQKIPKASDLQKQSKSLHLIARKALKLLWLMNGCGSETWFDEGGYVLRNDLRIFLKNKNHLFKATNGI